MAPLKLCKNLHYITNKQYNMCILFSILRMMYLIDLISLRSFFLLILFCHFCLPSHPLVFPLIDRCQVFIEALGAIVPLSTYNTGKHLYQQHLDGY